MTRATVIVGSGPSPFRPRERGGPREWWLALERGLVQPGTSLVMDPARWIAVVVGDAAPASAALNTDANVITYERLPADSPGLVAYRAGINPLRPVGPQDSWLRLANALAGVLP